MKGIAGAHPSRKGQRLDRCVLPPLPYLSPNYLTTLRLRTSHPLQIPQVISYPPTLVRKVVFSMKSSAFSFTQSNLKKNIKSEPTSPEYFV
jgi:hypothetical protein